MLVLSGGKYDSYCLNGGRLERREIGEANLEVCLNPWLVPLRCSFFLSWPATPEVRWDLSRVLVSSTH